MAYLSRQARRTEILQAAARIAMTEGLGAMTARRVATEAGAATGHVHHHFESVAQLRAEAFLLLIQQWLAALARQSEGLPATRRLQIMLGVPEDETGMTDTRLWNEAVFLSERDACMKAAYATCMTDWHQATMAIIDEGRADGEFTKGEPAADIAWRLIGLCCGLDDISRFKSTDFTQAQIDRHLAIAIERELR